jgi:hypothetical protein
VRSPTSSRSGRLLPRAVTVVEARDTRHTNAPKLRGLLAALALLLGFLERWLVVGIIMWLLFGPIVALDVIGD